MLELSILIYIQQVQDSLVLSETKKLFQITKNCIVTKLRNLFFSGSNRTKASRNGIEHSIRNDHKHQYRQLKYDSYYDDSNRWRHRG